MTSLPRNIGNGHPCPRPSQPLHSSSSSWTTTGASPPSKARCPTTGHGSLPARLARDRRDGASHATRSPRSSAAPETWLACRPGASSGGSADAARLRDALKRLTTRRSEVTPSFPTPPATAARGGASRPSVPRRTPPRWQRRSKLSRQGRRDIGRRFIDTPHQRLVMACYSQWSFRTQLGQAASDKACQFPLPFATVGCR